MGRCRGSRGSWSCQNHKVRIGRITGSQASGHSRKKGTQTQRCSGSSGVYRKVVREAA